MAESRLIVWAGPVAVPGPPKHSALLIFAPARVMGADNDVPPIRVVKTLIWRVFDHNNLRRRLRSTRRIAKCSK